MSNLEAGPSSPSCLTIFGFATLGAKNAAEAIFLRENEERVDVVISEVMMPGMNGSDFARCLRDQLPDLPVVLTSGYREVLAQDGHRGFELLKAICRRGLGPSPEAGIETCATLMDFDPLLMKNVNCL